MGDVEDKGERVCQQGRAAGSGQPIWEEDGEEHTWALGVGRRHEFPEPLERPLLRGGPSRKGRGLGGGFGAEIQKQRAPSSRNSKGGDPKAVPWALQAPATLSPGKWLHPGAGHPLRGSNPWASVYCRLLLRPQTRGPH